MQKRFILAIFLFFCVVPLAAMEHPINHEEHEEDAVELLSMTDATSSQQQNSGGQREGACHICIRINLSDSDQEGEFDLNRIAPACGLFNKMRWTRSDYVIAVCGAVMLIMRTIFSMYPEVLHISR